MRNHQGYFDIYDQKRPQLPVSQKVGNFKDFASILHQNVEPTCTTSSELYRSIGHREVGQRTLHVENLLQLTKCYCIFRPCF